MVQSIPDNGTGDERDRGIINKEPQLIIEADCEAIRLLAHLYPSQTQPGIFQHLRSRWIIAYFYSA